AQMLSDQIEHLVQIGLALSAEKRVERLFEMVVEEARRISLADAGTIYRVTEDGRHLDFVVMHNDTMNTYLGGTTGNPITLPPVHLFKDDGSENHANVSSHVAITGEMVNIPDVYVAEGFDFTGTRKYDAGTGYRSQSMLVLPMRNHEDEIIGVVQLLNSKDPDTGLVRAFPDEVVGLVGSLASQAAVALTNNQLIRDLQNLLYAFIQSIASAIDAKSPYTKGHIDRVVKLTMLIAEAVNVQTDGPYAQEHFTPDQMEELKLAAWMHDVGKITTPEHVVDKSTKLQTIFDRVELVRTRFELIGRGVQAELLERLLELASQGASKDQMRLVTAQYEQRRQELADEQAFVIGCNNPGEFMAPDKIERLKGIAAKTYVVDGEERPYLTEDEVMNLSIKKGSLTDAERKIIENHAEITREMLVQLPFPKRLAHVPDYASHHHEKMDGTGYPDGLTGDQLSLQSRILAVADVFEALTARDRPYKQPMKLSQAIKILGFMKKDNHIDADVFDLFVNHGLYKQYAEAELNPDQIDEVPQG
ncbi:MAG: GAF and HD-GYP domain-containing protein, partial [Desulfovibrionaceae bacterium]